MNVVDALALNHIASNRNAPSARARFFQHNNHAQPISVVYAALLALNGQKVRPVILNLRVVDAKSSSGSAR